MLLRAVKDSFVKLAPKTQVKNPVMMLVYVSAVMTTILFLISLMGIQDAPSGFTLAIAVILWFTVILQTLRRPLRKEEERHRQTPCAHPKGCTGK